ncbi:MAG: hypothetical protein OXB84_03920 [Halobacteriovoraceae bacterium]|nr:hypothetical protein [Halobacteriovoraceae bacterium]
MAKKRATKKSAKKKVKKKAAKKKVKKAAKKTSSKKSSKKKIVKKAAKKSVKKTAAKKRKKQTTSKASPGKNKFLNKNRMVANEMKEKLAEEILNLSENYRINHIFESISQIDFFKTADDDCMEKGCDNPATTLGHCRYHYIKNWNFIKLKQSILNEGKLQDLIQDLIGKYPLEQVEDVLNDLSDEKSFFTTLKELNIIDENVDDDSIDELEGEESEMAYAAKSGTKLYKDSFEEED